MTSPLPNPIPEALIEEAYRELNVEAREWGTYKGDNKNPVVYTLCRILWREGWRPPVDPDLIEAREVAAKWVEAKGNPKLAAKYREGIFDGELVVKLTLAGIKRGRELGSGV